MPEKNATNAFFVAKNHSAVLKKTTDKKQAEEWRDKLQPVIGEANLLVQP